MLGRKLTWLYLTAALLLCAAVAVQAQVKIDSNTFGGIQARSIGPASMSGRIMAIDAVNGRSHIVYVGAASGGLWKSTNGGNTFTPVFDKHVQSIGAIAIDQSRPDTVWAGTGESCTRNSVSVGSGLFKTTDGGENWKLMGLEKSERISKIVIDPKNSDVAYVAAVGNLWNSSEDRGLYKTADGGKTWQKALYVDAETGCSDVAIDPQETNVLYAGMWQFRRKPWTFSSGGPGSGIYKSTDAGKTWKKLAKGTPEGDLGRIAIAIAPSRPNVVYANIEAKKTALYKSEDMGESWAKVNESFNIGVRPFYFSHLSVDPKNYKQVYKPGFFLTVSRDGGQTFSNTGGSFHSDLHALWIDPSNTAFMYLGTDGGVYKSLDYGNTWTFMKNLPVSQFYHVSYDMAYPYNVYGGLQDNGSWMGPSEGPGGVRNKDWKNVGFGDGFYTFPDPTDKDIVYSEYQGGNLLRKHKSTGEVKSIKIFPKENEPKYRFNWNTPFVFGAKNPQTIYVGAQFLFRSRDKGESWERISDDLTTNNPEKQKQEQSGGLTIDNSTAENHCTIFSISESPFDEKTIWVGTDDGNVQLTRDGGKAWTNVTANIPGLPPNTWCSSINAGRHDAAVAYATFDGHQTGDMKCYVYKTADFGKTWNPIASDAIKGYAYAVREDLVSPNLLFVGTELGLFVTVDGGKQWAQFSGGLPNVSVRDIAIHPRENDLIIATHGRGVYIIDDITPLRQINEKVLESNVAVLESAPSIAKISIFEQDFPGDEEFVGANSAEAGLITYYLKDRHIFGDFKIEVYDPQGKLLTTLQAGKRKGINRVLWPMRLKPPKVPPAPTLAGGALVGPIVPEGTYSFKLLKGEETYAGQIKVTGDPGLPHSAEDRKLRQDAVMKLYGMQEQLGFVGALVVNARDQAKDRVQKLKKGDDATKALEAFAAKLDSLHKTLVATKEDSFYGITGEEQLREKIVELYSNVNGYGGRPTQSQLDRTKVLEAEIEKANKEFESITGKELEGINAKLKSKQIDQIKLLTKEEYEKQQQN